MILKDYLSAPVDVCTVLELHLMKLVDVLIQSMEMSKNEDLVACCIHQLILLLPNALIHVYRKLCIAVLKCLFLHYRASTSCVFLPCAAALYGLSPEQWEKIVGEVAVLDKAFDYINTSVTQYFCRKTSIDYTVDSIS